MFVISIIMFVVLFSSRNAHTMNDPHGRGCTKENAACNAIQEAWWHNCSPTCLYDVMFYVVHLFRFQFCSLLFCYSFQLSMFCARSLLWFSRSVPCYVSLSTSDAFLVYVPLPRFRFPSSRLPFHFPFTVPVSRFKSTSSVPSLVSFFVCFGLCMFGLCVCFIYFVCS